MMATAEELSLSKGAVLGSDQAVSRKPRNIALDLTKGVLVLLMVLYHWLNYFVPLDEYAYRYLRFITPSFIFITGFLIANVYLDKYDLGSALYRRLLQRGIKLLALFAVLNLAAAFMFSPSSSGLQFFVENLAPTFLTGADRAVAFSVLAPISYLLIVSPLLLLAYRWHSSLVPLVCGFGFISVYVLQRKGMPNPYLELFAVGMLGVVAGRLRLPIIEAFARQLPAIGLLYGVYVWALHRWGELYLLQVIGVCLSLLLIYGIGMRIGDEGWFHRRILLLGRYTLFSYILQIAIMVAMAILLRHWQGGIAKQTLSFFGSFGITAALIEITHALRARSKLIDNLYGVIFA